MTEDQKDLDRDTQALLALHDHGTRDGATKNSVLAAMKAEGFTLEEIVRAAAKMKGDVEIRTRKEAY